MAVQIQIRRDTADNWAENDPILAQGEFGYEIDTDKIKIGDGTVTWNNLPYHVGDVKSVSGKTGHVTLDKQDVGLGNVNNTSDANKTISTATQTALDGKQDKDPTLTALAAHNTNGILTQTAADTFTARTITGTTNQISVSDGDGVSGNPTLSLPQDIHTGASPTFAGLTTNGSINLPSSRAGGDDDGVGTDSTSRVNLYAYQRAHTNSFGENIRHYMMYKDAKSMDTWYFPRDGYDSGRLPVGPMKPVVWSGAHWEADNHASNHKHWSVETPDSTGAIQTRFEIQFGDPSNDGAIAGLDKTFIGTNLADLIVRTSNSQVLRIQGSAGNHMPIEFNHDYYGDTTQRRWILRANSTAESGFDVGTDFQLVRYDDSGTFKDSPLFIKRSTGYIGLGTTTGTSRLNLPADTTAAGGILFGTDTNLYRSAADTLKTDDTFIAANVAAGATVSGSNTGDQTTVTGNAGSATILQNARTINGVSFNGSANIRSDSIQPSDHNLLAWTYDPVLAVNAQLLGTAGLVYTARIYIPYAMTISNIIMAVTAGGGTLANAFVALYQGGNLLAQSSDQSSTWNSSGVKTMAITPQSVVTGSVEVAIWVGSWATAPTFARAEGQSSSLANVGLAAANSRFATADTGKTTTAPASLGTRTATATPFWVGLS